MSIFCFCFLSSVLARIQMWWPKSKQSPCSKREMPGVEAASTVRGKESRSFINLLPSSQPWTACVYVGEIYYCLFFSFVRFWVFWLLMQEGSLTDTPGNRWWKAHAKAQRRLSSAVLSHHVLMMSLWPLLCSLTEIAFKPLAHIVRICLNKEII